MPAALLQKTDLNSTSFSNDDTLGAGGVRVRTDTGSVVGNYVSQAIVGLKPISMTHAWVGANGAGTITLTWSDGSTLVANMQIIQAPVC